MKETYFTTTDTRVMGDSFSADATTSLFGRVVVLTS